MLIRNFRVALLEHKVLNVWASRVKTILELEDKTRLKTFSVQ